MECFRRSWTVIGALRSGELEADAGLESVEYALLAAVMLTALFVVVPTFANQLAPAYNAVMNALINALN